MAAKRQLAALYANVEDAGVDSSATIGGMELERKSYPFQVKNTDAAEGTATILVSVYNIPDADDDVQEPEPTVGSHQRFEEVLTDDVRHDDARISAVRQKPPGHARECRAASARA